MKYFEWLELFYSIYYAFIFGLIFTFTNLILDIFLKLVKSILPLFKSIIFYYKLFSPPDLFQNVDKKTIPSKSYVLFLKVIYFSFVFLLLSYLALDGCLRIYLFIIYLSVCVLCEKYLSRPLFKLFFKAGYYILFLFILIARIVFLPLKSLFNNKKLHFLAKKE